MIYLLYVGYAVIAFVAMVYFYHLAKRYHPLETEEPIARAGNEAINIAVSVVGGIVWPAIIVLAFFLYSMKCLIKLIQVIEGKIWDEKDSLF